MRCSVIRERLKQSISSVNILTGKAFAQQSTACVRNTTYQRAKTTNQKYVKLPPKQAETNPWETLCVDLIFLYTIRLKGKNPLKFWCFKMNSLATGLF